MATIGDSLDELKARRDAALCALRALPVETPLVTKLKLGRRLELLDEAIDEIVSPARAKARGILRRASYRLAAEQVPVTVQSGELDIQIIKLVHLNGVCTLHQLVQLSGFTVNEVVAAVDRLDREDRLTVLRIDENRPIPALAITI